MTKSAALNSFWSSFGLTAYNENSVPANTKFPYITYEQVTDSFGSQTIMNASIWYRADTWIEANKKTEQISKYIGRDGVYVDYDDGSIWIQRGTPFAQSMGSDSDSLIKRKALLIVAEYISED